MLECLDDIRWADLAHAYGPAGDVPDAIRALTSPHAVERRRALDTLWGSLCHQGAICAATSYAVPFLLELLATPEVKGKEHLLLLLNAFGSSGIHNAVDPDSWSFLAGNDSPEARRQLEEGYDWVRKTRAAVHAGCTLYTRLLADPSTRIRAAALALLISGCAGAADAVERVAELLRLQLGRERSPVLRIRLIDGLIRVGATDVETIRQITQVLRSTRDEAVRLAAAVALARMQGPEADAHVEAILLWSLISPESHVIQRYQQGIESPILGTSYIAKVSLALRQLGEQRVAQIQEALLRALAAQCHLPDASALPPSGRQSVPYVMPDGTMYWRHIEGRSEYPLPPALKLAQALLFLGFGAHPTSRPLPPHLREVPSLTEDQWKVVRGLVECEALWVYGRNMDNLLDLHRLPVTREDLRTLLAP
jgi:hypothetical protein